jgi:hypothetical protein
MLVLESNVRAPMPWAEDAVVTMGETATLTAESTIDYPMFLWWDSATDGNVVGMGDIFETPELFGEYKVWVSVIGEDFCESERREVTVTIISTETGPIYRVPNEY